MLDIYKNLIYSFYPKNICSFKDSETYINTKEYLLLRKTIDYFEKQNTNENILSILKLKINDFEINDKSLLSWNDRCLTYEINIIENSTLYRIVINLSLIIPFYLIQIFQNKINKKNLQWLDYPKITNSDKFQNITEKIASVIEKDLGFYKFNNNYTDKIISNISFEDITFGQFTYFNAFFKNEKI